MLIFWIEIQPGWEQHVGTLCWVAIFKIDFLTLETFVFRPFFLSFFKLQIATLLSSLLKFDCFVSRADGGGVAGALGAAVVWLNIEPKTEIDFKNKHSTLSINIGPQPV